MAMSSERQSYSLSDQLLSKHSIMQMFDNARMPNLEDYNGTTQTFPEQQHLSCMEPLLRDNVDETMNLLIRSDIESNNKSKIKISINANKLNKQNEAKKMEIDKIGSDSIKQIHSLNEYESDSNSETDHYEEDDDEETNNPRKRKIVFIRKELREKYDDYDKLLLNGRRNVGNIAETDDGDISNDELPDDDDDVDGLEGMKEFEAWKLRELKRIHRDEISYKNREKKQLQFQRKNIAKDCNKKKGENYYDPRIFNDNFKKTMEKKTKWTNLADEDTTFDKIECELLERRHNMKDEEKRKYERDVYRYRHKASVNDIWINRGGIGSLDRISYKMRNVVNGKKRFHRK